MVRSLFENSNRKLRSTFWGSPLILVGTNQAECCLYHLPISRFLLGSRLALHKFAPFLESNCNGCGNSVVNWKIANHYAFDTPTWFFCQIGKHLGLQIRVWNLPDNCRSLQCLVDLTLCQWNFKYFALFELFNFLTSNVSSETSVCLCNVSNNVIGGK